MNTVRFASLFAGRVRVDGVDGRAGVRADGRERADVHQGHRADLPGQVRSRATGPIRSRRCRSSPTSRARPWARSITRPRADAPDAALAHRQDRRHPAVRERSLADRRRDRHHRQVGGRRRAEGRPEGHAASRSSGRASDVWNFEKMYGKPDLIVKSPAYTQKARRRRTRGASPSSTTGLTEAALGARDRNPPRHRQGPQDHPPRPRPPAAGRRRHRRARSCPAATTRGPGLFMEWAVGKQGEMMRPNSGKLMLPGSKIVWDIHYHAVGEDITDIGRARHLLLSEGPGAEVPPGAALFSGITGGNRALDIPPNSVNVIAGLPRDEEGRPRRELPAAHAPARQGHVDGSDPADRPGADAQPGERLQLQLAHQLRLRRRRRRRCCRRARILRITSWHDNTAANKNNPDPNQWVGWGDRTVDEMAHAWVNITYMNDDDFKVEVDKRKAATATTTRAPAAVIGARGRSCHCHDSSGVLSSRRHPRCVSGAARQ